MAGHGAKERQPAQKRYTSERRWEKNKAARAVRLVGHLNKASAARARPRGEA